MEVSNKKQITLTIVAVVTLIALVAGATYAYFAVGVTNNFGTSTINATAEDMGSVALNGTNAALNLNLSSYNMMLQNSKYYWATADGTPSEKVNNIEIGHTQVTGEGRYNCEYTISVTQTGTNSMYKAFQGMTGKSDGQLVLMVGGKSYDFNKANLFPLTIKGTLTNLTSTTSKKINASFKIQNSKTVVQNALAGTQLNLQLQVTGFTCTAQDTTALDSGNYLAVNSDVTKIFGQTVSRSIFSSIELKDNINVPEGATIVSWDASAQQNNSVVAYYDNNGCADNNTCELYIGQNGGVIANQDSSRLFQDFNNVTSISNLDLLDTSNVTNMLLMFSTRSSSLTSLDLSNFDTSNVTIMIQMFGFSYNLTSLDLSNFDTSNVTSMQFMFSNCSGLTSLNLSNFDTSNVTNIGSMFVNCSSLTSLDVSNFDTSNVTNMVALFGNCNLLTSLDVSNFDTSNVTDMEEMFAGCSGLTSLDLSNFDTSDVTNMNWTFDGCTNLQKIYTSNKFVVTQVIDHVDMFNGCTSLVGGNGTTYNSNKTNKEYARIDAVGTPGYFTAK